MQASPQQELASLRAARAELTKEKEKLALDIEGWTAQISEKKKIITALEQTVAELQKPNGKRDGLLRCAAEFGQTGAPPAAAMACSDDKQGQQGTGPSREELDLGCRLASAVAVGPNADLIFGWTDRDFETEFALEEGDPMLEFFSKLSPEQRLFWEMQNPPEHSLKVDRQLLKDLKKAGRKQEAELLVTAAGPPTDRERQYRPLLWLKYNQGLDVSYAEPTVLNTSLLMLACQMGYADTARDLIARGADPNHVSNDNSTAALAACRRRSGDCVRLLLEGQVNPNEALGGKSLLMLAAGLGDTKKDQLVLGAQGQSSSEPVVRLLLEFAAEPNAVDARGRTAFMHAASKDNTKACKALLAARADPSAKDGEDKTAVELAVEGQHFELAEWLHTL